MLPGVYLAQKKDKTIYYRSSITYRGKHISLGSYDQEAKASLAYQEGSRILTDPSFTLDTILSGSFTLPWDKRVTLLNFRDNGIYFKNPIYLKSKYFLYFLSPQEELKFDADDLFYYSRHRLMRRGGHYFVSEYGMQTNILSRYGIKNFAVQGKDYLFVNGDSYDFRYSNIQIINHYYGVTRITQQNVYRYQARIHLGSSHLIGVYDTEELAAIAYNKAVDTVRKYGIKTNYTTNYLTELSPREYADAYTKVSLSPRLLKFLKNQ